MKFTLISLVAAASLTETISASSGGPSIYYNGNCKEPTAKQLKATGAPEEMSVGTCYGSDLPTWLWTPSLTETTCLLKFGTDGMGRNCEGCAESTQELKGGGKKFCQQLHEYENYALYQGSCSAYKKEKCGKKK